MRGSVRGCVVHVENGQAVEGATITVRRGPGRLPDIAPLTDSTGSFALDGLPEGEWVLIATSTTGREATGRVYVFDNAVSDLTIEIVGLPGARWQRVGHDPAAKTEQSMYGNLRGYVVRADNSEPVGNAAIEVVRGPAGAVVPRYIVSTDTFGWFTLVSLPEGEWVLSATGPAGYGQAVVQVFGNASSEVRIEIAGQPRGPQRRETPKGDWRMLGSVRGRVIRAGNGEPVADATIMVVRGAGGVPDIAPITDVSGRFALDGLPEGQWVLRALGPQGETGEGVVRVTGGTSTEVEIRAEMARTG